MHDDGPNLPDVFGPIDIGQFMRTGGDARSSLQQIAGAPVAHGPGGPIVLCVNSTGRDLTSLAPS